MSAETIGAASPLPTQTTTQTLTEVAKPLTKSKISWLSIANGIQNFVTAAMLTGTIPPIPGVPVALQPVLGIVLNVAVIYFRRQMAKQAATHL